MRLQLAEEAASIAEAHRDDVWQRVQSRLRDATPEEEPKCRRLPFSRQKEGGATGFPAERAEGRSPEPRRPRRMEGLLDIAKTRRYWSQLTKNAAGAGSERVWTASRGRYPAQAERAGDASSFGRNGMVARVAAVAAVLLLLVAALGPLPATASRTTPSSRPGGRSRANRRA